MFEKEREREIFLRMYKKCLDIFQIEREREREKERERKENGERETTFQN